MKAHLLFADRDFDREAPLPAHSDDIVADLELRGIVEAMGAGDPLVETVALQALMNPLVEADRIRYRQDIAGDCRIHPDVVREIYAVAVRALERKRHVFDWFTQNPSATLRHAVEVLGIYVEELTALRTLVAGQDHAVEPASQGLAAFYAMIRTELTDDYFNQIQAHLKRLRFGDGVLLSARLGPGGEGTRLVLRRRADTHRSLADRVNALTHPDPSFRIADRDEAGANALAELRGRGVNIVADALARSTDHITNFFTQVRDELAFYIGCLNLEAAVSPSTTPTLQPRGHRLSVAGLVDTALCVISGGRIVGNDVDADHDDLIVITGANRGGKSTLLRSLGQARLMAQCGMNVAALRCDIAPAGRLYTHFAREEDEEMTSGRLDEELARMSAIVDGLRPGDVVLFNESFSSTNEREGSEIARQIICALRDEGVAVAFVTHMYDLAQSFEGDDGVLFLRAERDRSFRLVPAGPQTTSFGLDLYDKTFGRPVGASAVHGVT